MRKIYSLVLMATMLLMGTNTWADDNVCSLQIGSGAAVEYATLQQAFDAMNGTTNSTVVLTMLQDASTGTAKQIWRTDGSYVFSGNDVTWNLNGHVVTNQGEWRLLMNGNNYNIDGGVGSQLNFANLPGNDYCGIYLYGETSEYSSVHTNLTVGAGVTISSKGYAIAIMARSNAAFNVKVDIYGNVITTTGEAAISILGTVNKIPSEGNEAAAPTINIYHGATVSGGNAVGQSAIYAAGYGIWNIDGNVSGATGIYAKAGVFDLEEHAVITGTGTYEKPTENNNGQTGGGSAIVFDSNANYAGHMELHVDGATVTSNNGAAVEELRTNTGETKTDSLVIASGIFNGNLNMGSLNLTPEFGENVQINGTITGGTYNSDITEYMGNVGGALQETSPGIYQVVEGCIAFLNAYGLATFSSPTHDVLIPEGSDLKAYRATGMDGNDLKLYQVAQAGQVLPHGVGLILYVGEAKKDTFNLYKSTNSPVAIDANILLPSTAWAASYKDNAYILHGNELWIYNGDEFKAGKAFLPMPVPAASAPKRISMIFNQTETPTAVENVETQNVKAVKFVGEDGQLYIRRGEAVYTVQGQVVK